MTRPLHVLWLVNQWPAPDRPDTVPFLVEQAAALRAAGVTLDVFVFRGAKNPLNYARAWFRLRRRVSLTVYDLLHAHFGQNGLLGLPRRRPLIVTYHGSDLQGDVGATGRYTQRGQLLAATSRLVARRADANVIVSGHLRAYLPAGQPATVIPCAVDTGRFQPRSQAEARAELGLPQADRIVLFAANPTRPVKGFELARAAVDLLGDSTTLLTLGGVSPRAMPAYVNAADVLVLTSYHEGSPMVVKEALACDRPVVSLPVGDVPARLAGVAGCAICAAATPAAVAAGLAQALAHGPVVAGRATLADVTPEVVTGRLLTLYRQMAPTETRS